MLDATASNTYHFLLKDTCVSSTHLNTPIWNKESLPPPLKTKVAGSIPFQSKVYSHVEIMCYILQVLT
jgi:hypothetical protein